MPYREKAERPPIPVDARRWYTRQGDVEKGPYDEAALVHAVKTKMLRATTLVRAEDETEWRPFSQVERLAKKTTSGGGRRRAEFDPERDLSPSARGSFGQGFAAGFFAGIIGYLLVLGFAKGAETKRGALMGFLAQIGVGIVRVVIALMAAGDAAR
jgi:hypothetical protein